MSLLRTFSIVAAFALTPNLAHAFTYTICLKHLVHTVDSDVGEDFEVSPTGFSAWISRGSQVRVMKGGSWMNLPNTNTTTGCTTFNSPTGGAVIVELTAKHSLANGQVVMVRNTLADPQIKVWSFTGALPDSDASISLETPYSKESNLAAIAPFVVHRLTSLTGNIPHAANRVLNVFNQDCSILGPTCLGSALSGPNIFISPDFTHAERKFLVAHEVGHWIEIGWRGGASGGGGSYGFNDLVPLCQFTGLGGHGMFSREDDFLSYQEAMGHFISAIAWNDPAMHSGVFKYYKDQAPYNFDTILLDTPGAWPFDWEGTSCAPKLSGKSTEGDWLRLFWNYHNDVGWNFQPSLLDIATHVRAMFLAGGLVSSNAYAKFTDAVIAGYPWFELQWETLAQDHGPVDP